MRLSVRGSGIARGFHLHGVEVLQDGIPVNSADGVAVAPGVSVFLDTRNLINKRYASDLGTITDARRTGSPVFYPGEGRSVYVETRMAF